MRSLLMLLALTVISAARPAIAGCLVRGEHVTLHDVVVRADRSTTFEVGLADVPARATIGAGSRVRLDVSGAIAFRGTRENVWFQVARPVTTGNGVVRLSEGAELVHARADGDGVVASVVLWADDVLPGEDKEPDEVIVGVRVPCRALRLGEAHGEGDDQGSDGDDAANEPGAEPAPKPDPALGWWRKRQPRKSIVVRAAPRAEASGVTLSALVGEGLLDFEGIEQRDGWLRVRRSEWGAKIVGWVPRAELEALDHPLGRTIMCTGNHDRTFYGGGWGGKLRYKGPARIRVGAPIRYGDQLWGKVRRREGFEVLIFEDPPYAELTNIPGIGVPPMSAMVNPADVILPAAKP